MQRWRVLIGAVCGVCLCAASARAQQGEPTSVYGVVGILSQQVNGAAAVPGPLNRPGPTIGFQFRTAREHALGWAFEVMAQPLPALAC